MMQVKFPNESIWETYNSRLRAYACQYPYHLSISKRKNDKGYFIFIIKNEKREIKAKGETNENLEVKSI
jgi:hypothetical protein